ncbi:hypothetical protein HZY83_05825 [Gemella sp. GH3]|uniref:hypothetical protein n=1 Tax=unclassified Gemella TaxID=2624949 RepID=UPI0015D00CC6|nr:MULTISPECIES: hypothetical protein [unclassified Gemella]MBF0714189.1 hypothetical protein [Gemella sp. GH3.1]NYS51141.1 hypothetical protein [Gemella sp. GH3]
MNLRKYSTLTYILLITFIFFYTLNSNLHIDRKINYLNMLYMFILFILWLFAWYLFFIKDIIKSNQQERNRISTVLILLAIILFYHNPLPSYDSYIIDIDRKFFFILTIISFISFIIFSKNKPFLPTGILVFLPIVLQSFCVNILKNDTLFVTYPYFTTALIIILLLSFFGYKQIKQKK